MGILVVFALALHLALITLPAVLGAIVVANNSEKTRIFWATTVVACLLTLGARIYWTFQPHLSAGEGQVWPIYFQLLFGKPFFVSLAPLAFLIPLMLMKKLDFIYGLVVGILASVLMQMVVANFCLNVLFVLFGIEKRY